MIEAKIQQEIYLWFSNNFCRKIHEPKCVIFSVPNETQNRRELMYKKALGLLSGVSDLIVIFKKRVIFVEVKTQRGKQSENQKKFEKAVNKLGFEYYVVRSLNDFKKII